MQDKLFIPKKIKVGYQNRGDTYTKRLAYIIYYDEKGKLRKETSWDGWRDKNIPADEFENKPHSGFVINKDVQRSSEWFGSGRNMIRVYDDRGMEFEITCDNLIFILMSTDCLKRGLQGEFVYAWQGKELLLLPVDCEEYKSSIQFTEFKTKKVSTKELILGCSYKTKNMEDLIYLGKFDYYSFEWDRSYNHKEEKIEKMHIFINNDKYIVPLKSLTSLAIQNTDIPVSNYADLMDVFNKSDNSSPIKGLKYEATKETFILKPEDYYFKSFDVFKKENDNIFFEFSVNPEFKSVPIYAMGGGVEKWNQVLQGYKIYKQRRIVFDNKLIIENVDSTERYSNSRLYSIDEIKDKNFVDLYAIDSNNNEKPINKYK